MGNNLVRGHLHSIETETPLHIHAQGIGKLCVVLLHIVALRTLLLLDALQFHKCHLVGRQLGSDGHTAQNGFVLLVGHHGIGSSHTCSTEEEESKNHQPQVTKGELRLHNIFNREDGIHLGGIDGKMIHHQCQGVGGISLTIYQHLEGRKIVKCRVERGHRVLIGDEHLILTVQILCIGLHLAHNLDTRHQHSISEGGHHQLALRGKTHLELHLGLLTDKELQRVDAGINGNLSLCIKSKARNECAQYKHYESFHIQFLLANRFISAFT